MTPKTKKAIVTVVSAIATQAVLAVLLWQGVFWDSDHAEGFLRVYTLLCFVVSFFAGFAATVFCIAAFAFTEKLKSMEANLSYISRAHRFNGAMLHLMEDTAKTTSETITELNKLCERSLGEFWSRVQSSIGVALFAAHFITSVWFGIGWASLWLGLYFVHIAFLRFWVRKIRELAAAVDVSLSRHGLVNMEEEKTILPAHVPARQAEGRILS